jgi:cyclophilin family peptidyl-prolyl cis-trans isomerase
MEWDVLLLDEFFLTEYPLSSVYCILLSINLIAQQPPSCSRYFHYSHLFSLTQLDSDLLYGVSSEDDGRGSAATTLQFQSYGALGMAREEFAADSASTQFFWLLFESDLTPAGRNLLDGRYALFGYTLDGADLLKDVKEGDIIASAKVTRGIENLVRGSVTSVAPVAITEL